MKFVCAIALASLISMLSAGCPPPGKGGKAERGFEKSQIVIDALARYKADRGRYPESLEALAPAYLSADDLQPPVDPDYPFEYEAAASDYLLAFRYVGPGMNRCTFTSQSGEWDCSGYF